MREITLCDICEGAECGDACEIRASKQRSAKSAFDTTEELDAKVNSSSQLTPTFILIAAILMTLLTR